MKKEQRSWLNVFLQSSGLGLFFISFIWIGLEFLFTGWYAPSTIDTIVAFVVAVVIGYIYTRHVVKKKGSKPLVVTKSHRQIEE